VNVLEAVLLWAAIVVYIIAVVAALLGWALRKPSFARAANLWPIGLLLHLGAGLARWVATGHAPVMYSYENSLTGSFFVALIYWWVARRFTAARAAMPLVLAAVILILGNGVSNPQNLAPLEPPFRSGWLAVHVTFAWVAFGSYLVASVLAVLYLVRSRQGAPSQNPQRNALLDDLTGRLIAIGFAGDTVMVASGAIWAHGLWGRYWGWDPVETWSLISWLIYGINLHLRFTLGWRGRRAAWLAVVSVVAIIITFFGIGVISDVHTELL